MVVYCFYVYYAFVVFVCIVRGVLVWPEILIGEGVEGVGLGGVSISQWRWCLGRGYEFRPCIDYILHFRARVPKQLYATYKTT